MIRNLYHDIQTLLLLACGLMLSGTCHAQTAQLRLVEKQWGFDGRVVVGQFNPLRLLIDNLSDDVIDGEVTLRAVHGMVRESGTVLREPIYLAPHTRRWVHFYPYVGHYSGGSRVTVRSGGRVVLSETADLPRPVFLPDQNGSDARTLAAVILDRTAMATQTPVTLPHLPAEVFPPWSTATCGLSRLFLDHVPDWEEPRQQALLSWVKTGGKLHLLRDQNGQELNFSGVLSTLNQPFPVFAIENGLVTRHDFQREQLTKEFVEPLVRQNEPPDAEDAETPELQYGYYGGQRVLDPPTMDDDLLSGMRELTQPEHAWWLILILSMVYIGLIFPGCWMLSQKKSRHYLTTYGAIAGLSIVFSTLFLMIGRRGYGESTVMNSLTIARFEDATHWNAIQWMTLFVVSGDQYVLSSEDQQALIASGNAEDTLTASVTSGNNARMESWIPPFSSQSVIARRRLEQPDWKLVLTSAEVAGGGLVSASMSVSAEFPRDPQCQYLILYGDRLYSAALNGDGTELVLGRSMQSLSEYCQIRREQNYGFSLFGFARPRYDNSISPETRFYQQVVHSLVHRSLLDDGADRPDTLNLPADRLRLLVYAPTSDANFLQVNTTSRQRGWTLFVRDIPIGTPAVP